MTVNRNIIFWITALLLAAFALWLLKGILLPFVAGFALAYMQAPLADRLERIGMNRILAALVIVSVVVLILILPAILVAPVLSAQTVELMAGIPGYVTRLQAMLFGLGSPWLQQVFGGEANKPAPELITQGAGYLTGFLDSLWTGGGALISFVSFIVIMPVVTFYLICDWRLTIDALNDWVPRHRRETVRQIVREIDAAISGFLRGQTAICLIVGLYFAVTLSLVGLKFALLIGLVNGVLTFVPYLGPTIGILIGVGVAVGQFWPQWTPIAIVVGIFLSGQFIAAYVLGPKLVGDRVGLRPIWLIFAMFAFGYLFGFFGLLIAVPLGAATAVLFRFALAQYLESPIYRGEES